MNPSQRHDLTLKLDRYLSDEARLGDPDLRPDQGTLVDRFLADALNEEGLVGSTREELALRVKQDLLGFGPLEPLIADPEVSEIMVVGHQSIYVERDGRLTPLQDGFVNEDFCRRAILRMLEPLGRRLDEQSPTADGRLVDGSRINAVLPPISPDGPMLTIRKFKAGLRSLSALRATGMFGDDAHQVLIDAVTGSLNLLVCGGTGAGKTTLLNALAREINPDERVITLEDAAELSLGLPHTVRLETRPPNMEGEGSVTLRDLLINALRMRPDRLVVGECRGPEALDMLQAMNTGHRGCMTTVHANSARDAIRRLEVLTLLSGVDIPVRAIREQIAGAIDVICHVGRDHEGRRFLTQIERVVGLEGEQVLLESLWSQDSDEVASQWR